MPVADISGGMTAVAVEIPLEVPPLRPFAEAVERWELHSELAVVSPEVRTRALELLPDRNPDGFLQLLRRPIVVAPSVLDEVKPGPRLAVAVSAYAVGRLLHTARSALFFVAALVALASVIEVLH